MLIGEGGVVLGISSAIAKKSKMPQSRSSSKAKMNEFDIATGGADFGTESLAMYFALRPAPTVPLL